MGFGGISPVQLIIILVIVLLIFGTKKLRNFGGDLGGAIRGFKKAVKEETPEELEDEKNANADAAPADTAKKEAEEEPAKSNKGT